MKYSFTPKYIFQLLVFAILFLLVANISATIIRFNTENIYLRGLAYLFDFNKEDNIPTLFSSFLLLTASVLLFCLHRINKKIKNYKFQWLIFSFLFFFLTMDELFSFHEKLIPVTKEYYNFSGYLYYSWIIPYAILLVILAVLYLPFLCRLPKETFRLFLLSAILFISGAIGMELLGGYQHDQFGRYNFEYVAFYTIEELLEMIGVSVFIFALLRHIAKYTDNRIIQIKLHSEDNSEEAHKESVVSVDFVE